MEKDIFNFKTATHPKGIVLESHSILLEPLSIKKHTKDLFQSNALDEKGINWYYLPYGPFDDVRVYSDWLKGYEAKKDPVFFAIIKKTKNKTKNKAKNKAIGLASYLNINQIDGSIEVGHLNYSPLLQQTKQATEAMYLMMRWVFENGYRRYEWKCNALNIKSRKAAQRLGFSFEGVFRQTAIIKGKNRDTAWFAIIDKDWQRIETCFLQYLDESNYDNHNKPIHSLSALTKPYLYKLDSGELSR